MPCNSTNTFSGPLAILFSPADTGQRPITTYDPSNPPWFNQAITLTDPSPGGGSQTGAKFYQVQAGHSYVIEVVVSNISTAGNPSVENVNVEVWASNFTAGGVGPGSDIDHGGAALTGFVLNPIPPQSSGTASVAWTPTAADVATNGGHICLAVNCYAGSSALASEGTPLSGTTAYLNVTCDSHQGQHNVMVVPVPGGMKRNPNFKFVVTNPHQRTQTEAIVRVTPVHERHTLSAAERNVLIGRRLVVHRPDFPPTRPLPGGPSIETARLHNAFASLANETLHLAPSGARQPHIPIHVSHFPPVDYEIGLEGFGTGREVKVGLQPGRPLPVTMHLDLDPRATVGSVQSFDVTTADVHGELLGGARIITIVTD